MESLVNQMRVRFSGLGQDSQEGPSNIRERRLPIQKSQSFKGGKKTQNWFRRQFSGQMNQDNMLDENSDFIMAIAAAAFAIHSNEEAVYQNPRISSLNKSKSRKEDGGAGMRGPGRVSRRFSGEEVKIDPGDTFMRKSEMTDRSMPGDPASNQKMPEKTAGTGPSIKKTEGHLNDKGSTNPGTEIGTRPTVNRIFSRSRSGKQEKTTVTGDAETKADAWEKAEMARINKKFERMVSTIVAWENEKKAKAKRRADKIESEIERKRGRTLQRYRGDMLRIDKIAGGARAAADEKRRNEECKAKEKANKIRATGKVPPTCFCF